MSHLWDFVFIGCWIAQTMNYERKLERADEQIAYFRSAHPQTVAEFYASERRFSALADARKAERKAARAEKLATFWEYLWRSAIVVTVIAGAMIWIWTH